MGIFSIKILNKTTISYFPYFLLLNCYDLQLTTQTCKKHKIITVASRKRVIFFNLFFVRDMIKNINTYLTTLKFRPTILLFIVYTKILEFQEKLKF